MLKPVAAPLVNVRFKDLGLVFGGSLLVAMSAQIAIPLPWTPVPVTLQPLAVLLVGAFLGPWRGSASMFLYLLEGVAGLPVFTPIGAPGVARLLGPTGGYLISYPLAAFIIGHFADRGWTKTFRYSVPAFLLSSFVILFFGGAWMVLAGARTWSDAMTLGVLPFLPWDFLKILFAASLTSLVARKRK